MSYNDISLDCETLSVRFDAPIISIGAVPFNRKSGLVDKKKAFYVEVDLDSAMKCGQVLGSTLSWWMMQSQRAKQVFANDEKATARKVSLSTALVNLNHWVRDLYSGGVTVWAKGPSQDIAWLERAYIVGSHGLSVPWIFHRARDVRTIVELAEDLTPWTHGQVPDYGVAHNSTDDAIYQAGLVSGAYQALRTATGDKKPAAASDEFDEFD